MFQVISLLINSWLSPFLPRSYFWNLQILSYIKTLTVSLRCFMIFKPKFPYIYTLS